MSFAGLRVLSLESRRAKEIEAFIRRLEGDPFVAPSVQERALEEHAEVERFIERLEHGDFEMLICMTGAGIEFLRDAAAAHMPLDRFASALRRAVIVSRGPKPLPALRALNVPVEVVIPEPNTWKEIVQAVAHRPERKIAVQEYGRPNLEMNTALEKLGANVTPIAIYRWELPDDVEPLREAVRRLADGKCDVAIFTSSIQLDHLLEVAGQEGLEEQALRALRERVAVASVGPVMTASLEARGIQPDIIPQHPKMWALVKAAAELSNSVLDRKRSGARSSSPQRPIVTPPENQVSD
jgi:uroporphyrinogen-III synthase